MSSPTATANTLGGENLAILDQLLRACCIELMGDYGLPAQLADVGPETATGVAVAAVDFSGRDVRGTIGLRMTSSVVLQTYRAALGRSVEFDSPEAKDWSCELANQLIGRLKNKLRTFEVSFNVNSPRWLQIFPVAELERALRRRFICDGGTFSGYLDVLIAPGFVFVPRASNAPLAQEGDLVLF